MGRPQFFLPLVLALAGCVPAPLVPLAPPPAAPPAGDPLMRVTCRPLPEPLVLRGGRARYTDLDRALCAAVGRAVQPFVERNRGRRPAGWDLLIDVTQAEARLHAGRLTVLVTAGATLRARDGQIHLGQAQSYCRESGPAAPADAAPVFWACAESIGRDLSAWLGGVAP